MSRWPLAVLLAFPLPAGAQSFDFAAAKAVPQAPARVDLSGQFGDGPRRQGKIGSCHTFVAVALIEAAYFRQYGRRVRLSEADLFVRRNAAPALPFLRARDTGMLRPDLRYALNFGVMPGDFYEVFEARYHAFEKRFFKFLDRKRSVVEELLPESATPEANAAREMIRRELEEFSPDGVSFFKFIGAAARSAVKKDAVKCDEARVAGYLERRLNAGMPVGVGLNTGWTKSPAWRKDSNGPGGSHYFVVKGYDRSAAGPVFHTRNTWSEEAGGSPDLSGADLCEIFGMSWVVAPVDAEPVVRAAVLGAADLVRGLVIIEDSASGHGSAGLAEK